MFFTNSSHILSSKDKIAGGDHVRFPSKCEIFVHKCLEVNSIFYPEFQ